MTLPSGFNCYVEGNAASSEAAGTMIQYGGLQHFPIDTANAFVGPSHQFTYLKMPTHQAPIREVTQFFIIYFGGLIDVC